MATFTDCVLITHASLQNQLIHGSCFAVEEQSLPGWAVLSSHVEPSGKHHDGLEWPTCPVCQREFRISATAAEMAYAMGDY